MGSRTTSSAAAATTSARANPMASMSRMSAGAMTTPPSVAPLNAMLTARPRRRSNHGATMMLSAAPLIAPQPTAMTRNTGKSCQGRVAAPSAATPVAIARLPIMITTRGPNRS